MGGVLVETGEIGLLADRHPTCMLNNSLIPERDIAVLVLDHTLLVVARSGVVVAIRVILCLCYLVISFMPNIRLPVHFSIMPLHWPRFNPVLRLELLLLVWMSALWAKLECTFLKRLRKNWKVDVD